MAKNNSMLKYYARYFAYMYIFILDLPHRRPIGSICIASRKPTSTSAHAKKGYPVIHINVSACLIDIYTHMCIPRHMVRYTR